MDFPVFRWMSNFCFFTNQPIRSGRVTFFTSFYIFMSFVYSSLLRRLSLTVRETRPNLLIDWLAKTDLYDRLRSTAPLRRSERSVMSRRDDTHFNVLLSCIFLIAFVLNIQWIGQNSFPSRVVEYKHRGGCRIILPFIYFSDLHFLFV